MSGPGRADARCGDWLVRSANVLQVLRRGGGPDRRLRAAPRGRSFGRTALRLPAASAEGAREDRALHRGAHAVGLPVRAASGPLDSAPALPRSRELS